MDKQGEKELARRETRLRQWPAPFLRSLSVIDVESFCVNLVRYRADGGPATVIDLLDDGVLELLCVVHPGFRTTTEEEQLETLRLGRSVSLDGVIEHVSSLRMRGTGVDNYVAYCTTVLRVCKRSKELQDKCFMSKYIIAAFIAGVEPKRVSRRLELFRSEPVSGDNETAEVSETNLTARGLREIISKGLELVKEEEQARQLLGATSLLAQQMSVAPARAAAIVPRDAAKVCYRCGKKGHVAAVCRSADVTASRVKEVIAAGGPRTVGQNIVRRCYICRAEDHLANVCPHRGRGESVSASTTGTSAGTSVGSTGRQRPYDLRNIPGTARSSGAAKTISGVDPFLVPVCLETPVQELGCKALIDTGATDCFVSPVVAERLSKLGVPEVAKQLQVTLACRGTRKSSSRAFETVVRVMVVEMDGSEAEVKQTVTLHEVPELDDEIVLGTDPLLAMRVEPRVRDHTLVLQEGLSDKEERLREYLDEEGEVDLSQLWEGAAPELLGCLQELCHRYAELFGALHPDGSTLPPHCIELLPDARPVVQTVRRLSPKQYQFVKEEVDMLLQKHIIRPSESPWASPLVLVRKRGGQWRMCIDYRALNARTQRFVYPLPRMDDLFDALSGQRYFASIDMSSGYWQVKMEERAVPMTAFVTPFGHYEFTRMPFGLAGAPSTFQRGMNTLLVTVDGIACLVYLDDLIVFGKSVQEFVANLERVFQLLVGARIRLNVKKTKLGRTRIAYLGQEVSQDGRRIDPDRLQGIRDLKAPSNVRELKSFLGLVSYYRGFLEGLAHIAHPLYQLLRKGSRFDWGVTEDAVFARVKELLLEAGTLRHPDFDKPFIVRTDASNHGIGAVLLQEGGAIVYLSRTLTPTEVRWTVNDKEAFAVVWAVDKLRPYLLDRKFLIETDHNNLRFIDNGKSARVVRWRLKLSEYDFDIVHIPGKENTEADVLSRLCVVRGQEEGQGAQVKSLHVEEDEPYVDAGEEFQMRLREAQVLVTKEELDAWSKDQNCMPPTDTHPYWRRRVQAEGDTYEVALIPLKAEELKARLVALSHSHCLAGHFGTERMHIALRQSVYWKGMRKDIESYVRACPKCQRVGPTSRYGPFLTTATREPMDTWHLDFVGPLPSTPANKRYLLVMVERFTRFVELFPVERADADEAVSGFFGEIICRHGIPRRVVTDGGSHFKNQKMEEFCNALAVKHHVIIPYHPQANGAVERQNQTVMKVLRALVEQLNDWDQWIPAIRFAMNAAVNKVTGMSPFTLLYGRSPVTPLVAWTSLPVCGDESESADESEGARRAWKLRMLWQRAQERQDELNEVQKKRVQSQEQAQFKPGDLVLLWIERRPTKLAPKWKGPYKVMKRINPVVFVVRHLVTGDEEKVHANRLKVFDASNLSDEQVMHEALPQGEYLIESCLDHKWEEGVLYYFVHWLGYPVEQRSWEPADNVGHVESVRGYAREHALPL